MKYPQLKLTIFIIPDGGNFQISSDDVFGGIKIKVKVFFVRLGYFSLVFFAEIMDRMVGVCCNDFKLQLMLSFYQIYGGAVLLEITKTNSFWFKNFKVFQCFANSNWPGDLLLEQVLHEGFS